MADLARDASGRASSEPAGIALQQANRPASSDKGKLRVFISYSRDDLKFADQLDAALNACGFECLIDREGISGGEDWKRRLGDLISEADTVVFVLSPSSLRSPTCAWEVDEAAQLNKRILPVPCRPLEGVSAPPRLSELNYIFFYEEPKFPGSGFGTGLASLVAALNTDFDWLREHTRYLQRAMEWDTGGRPANRLLSGNDILEAKAWVARRPKGAPEPTALQLDFIHASEEEAAARMSAERKQIQEIAAAQAEREKALQQEEEAQRKRATMARVRNIALVAVSILAVVAGWLFLRAEQQRKQADYILTRATRIISNLQDQMDIDTQKEAFQVFQAGAEHGNAISMQNLGVLYAAGQGVARDYAKAHEWFDKAVEKGDVHAMVGLGLLYHNSQGVAQDDDKAREWYEKAAAKDDADAMVHLGALYENAQGVAQDDDKAREWYEKAGEKGDADAMAHLGAIYGVARDYAKANEWFEEAAAKDNADGMVGLGLLYHNGHGVARDYVKAREWYEKAAAKDNADAMYSLGWLYANGKGVAPDYVKAREWYEKAAAKDNADAMVGLGALYENDQDVARDDAKAREWYEKAAARGDARAKMALEQLPIHEAETLGRYDEALRLEETLAAKVEAEETKRDGSPGPQTAEELNTLIWDALLAKEFTKALTVADRAHTLSPDNLAIEVNRAHALMFLERDEDAKALYLAHKGEPVPEEDNKLWEQAVADDFAGRLVEPL